MNPARPEKLRMLSPTALEVMDFRVGCLTQIAEWLFAGRFRKLDPHFTIVVGA
jgi:hypothetical protein